MAKRKPDDVADEPKAKRRAQHSRSELELSETRIVAKALEKRPDQQRVTLPCPIHGKKRVKVDMYMADEKLFGLSNKHTELPFLPMGPEGDSELGKATAELLTENHPLTTEQNRDTLVKAVETILLDKFDIVNSAARILGILDDALELAWEQTSASQQQRSTAATARHNEMASSRPASQHALFVLYRPKSMENRLKALEERKMPASRNLNAEPAHTIPMNPVVPAASVSSAAPFDQEAHQLLDTNEKKVILKFTSGGLAKLNGALRVGVIDPPSLQFADDFDRALKKLPPCEGTVYCSADVDEEFVEKLFRSEGTIYIDRAFLSTTFIPQDEHPSESFKTGNCWFKISSKSGRDISKLAAKDFKSEVVFRRNARFQVLSVEDDPVENRFHVTMEEVV